MDNNIHNLPYSFKAQIEKVLENHINMAISRAKTELNRGFFATLEDAKNDVIRNLTGMMTHRLSTHSSCEISNAIDHSIGRELKDLLDGTSFQKCLIEKLSL